MPAAAMLMSRVPEAAPPRVDRAPPSARILAASPEATHAAPLMAEAVLPELSDRARVVLTEVNALLDGLLEVGGRDFEPAFVSGSAEGKVFYFGATTDI